MTNTLVTSAITPLCDPVDIARHRNNTAISAATETKAGAFNVWGNSFAAEYLPAGGSLVHVAGVPFRFPPVCDGPDNVLHWYDHFYCPRPCTNTVRQSG